MKAQEIVFGVLLSHAALLRHPEPLMLVDELGGSTVNLEIHFWFNGQTRSQVKVRSALLRLIRKALMEAEISMPDDAWEIIFPEGAPVISASPQTGRDAPAAVGQSLVAPAPLESAASVTAAEGDLINERADLATSIAAEPADALGENLLDREGDGDGQSAS